MKHVSIFIPPGHTSIVNIEGTHQIFNKVNSRLKSMERTPLFKVELVGISKETSQRNGLFKIDADELINDIKKTDLIIIPAIHGDPKTMMQFNTPFILWIIGQHNAGAEVASLCIASFFLATTGLLDGKQCATHWSAAYDFRNTFPEVNESIITFHFLAGTLPICNVAWHPPEQKFYVKSEPVILY